MYQTQLLASRAHNGTLGNAKHLCTRCRNHTGHRQAGHRHTVAVPTRNTFKNAFAAHSLARRHLLTLAAVQPKLRQVVGSGSGSGVHSAWLRGRWPPATQVLGLGGDLRGKCPDLHVSGGWAPRRRYLTVWDT
eukprot:scaffold4314_cov388-Prasinococcus_capsulatus_cf.AAC.4